MIGIMRAVGALIFPNACVGEEKGHNTETGNSQPVHDSLLVIDDDTNFLQTLRPSLLSAGYNVLTSNSGAKGLDMLRYADPPVKLVVLDYNMPRLNGADTLAHLRAMNPHIKVIAVTGLTTDEVPVSFRQGVDRFMPKPFRTEELVRAVNGLLQTAVEPSAA